MDVSAYSSTSSLFDLDSLKQKLEEKEELLMRAAQYGSELLITNNELSQSLEETERLYTQKLETLKEENYALAQQLELKTRMEEEYQEEIDILKKHISSQREDLKALNELGEHSTVATELRRKLREQEENIEKADGENQMLKSLVSSYELRLEDSNEKFRKYQRSISENTSEEISSLLTRLNELTAEKEDIEDELSTKSNEALRLAQQVESQQFKIANLLEELKEANAQLNKISNSFMATAQENQELRCELDIMRTNDRDHKQKGNSMFSELDDKRQEAEKKLMLLNVQYDSLQNQYNLLKKQTNSLKIQMSNVLRMASGKVDSDHVADLENQLHEARSEIQTLTSKLSKATSTERIQNASNITSTDARKTLAFTENLIKNKDEEIALLSKELQERRLRSTYDFQVFNDMQHKMREMESKANKLQAQNIKLSVKLDELKSKYEPGSDASSTKLESGKTEVIPDFNPQFAAILLGEHTQTTPACPRVSVQQRTMAENLPPLSEAPKVKEEPKSPKSPMKVSRNTNVYINSSPARKGSSSQTSLVSVDGQVNVKSCDSGSEILQKPSTKVINVSQQNADASTCATQ